MPIRQTFRDFVDTLEAVTVTGVTRHYTQGVPASLTDADLPAKWVQFPRGTEGALVFGEHGGRQTLSCDIVIAVVSTAQSIQGENFDLTVDLMDNLMTALLAMGLCDFKSRWSSNIRQTVVQVAGFDYWAIVCTVEG
jgi:hypothetical protein